MEAHASYGPPLFRRVLLKLSGESFCRPGEAGISVEEVSRIARQAYQNGLLAIARELPHQDGHRCERCAERVPGSPGSRDLFLEVLRVADRGWVANLVRALRDPAAFRIFVR